jgi:hypothetical protein
MDGDTIKRAYALVHEALGDWWTDDRRNWCAYCGIPMRRKAGKGRPLPPTKSTRDHVIPRKQNGGLLTIPACKSCNEAKGALSLQQFLLTEHFRDHRKHRHKHQWSVDQLWLVAAAAALKRSIALLETARAESLARERSAEREPRIAS